MFSLILNRRIPLRIMSRLFSFNVFAVVKSYQFFIYIIKLNKLEVINIKYKNILEFILKFTTKLKIKLG